MGEGGGCRVYVGNLAWRVRWQDLKDHMKKVGEVRFVEVIESPDGRSKGCAVVEYADEATAARAIMELNDTELFDRKIFVREDRVGGHRRTAPPPPRSAPEEPRQVYVRSDDNRRDSGDNRQLYVANLPWSVDWKELKQIFGGSEVVERADVASDKEGRSRGFGFVVMKTRQAAENAVQELDGMQVHERKIMVKVDTGPPVSRRDH